MTPDLSARAERVAQGLSPTVTDINSLRLVAAIFVAARRSEKKAAA